MSTSTDKGPSRISWNKGRLTGQKPSPPMLYRECLRRRTDPTISVEMLQMIPLHRDSAFYQLLADSYAQLLGRPLVQQAMPAVEATEWLS